MLRSYPGLFTVFVNVIETELARRVGIGETEVVKALHYLQGAGILSYQPRKTKPQLTFVTDRLDEQHILLSPRHYAERKQSALKRLVAVTDYATSTEHCRSQILLAYFGENREQRCGICDVCIERNKAELSAFEFDDALRQVKPLLMEGAFTIQDILGRLQGLNEDKAIRLIRWLGDNDKIIRQAGGKITWKKPK
jgi:ATP-dependent DNA helicase RecQ